MNKVILMGRLTRDVEMRQTPSGVSLARFSIAVNRRFASKDAQQTADFINCAAWRQTGEFISRYFHKGSMIAVVGSLQSRSWDGQDGNKHYSTEVIVDEAYFTGSKAETGTQGGGNYGGNNGYGYNNNSNGGYGNNNNGYGNGGYPAPAQQSAPAAPQQDAFGGFDDGGFMDIDGSEDDLPF
jgi:single-strand DNA-binding protein